MLFSNVVKLFRQGNVCVTGLRGTGKDLLMGNVIARRDESYVSNLDYGGSHFDLDLKKLDCGGNTYDEFIDGCVYPYVWQYPKGADVYISDCGIYFPSQYCSQLNNKYGSVAVYQALSRQVSHNNVHINAQNLNRVWDKIREQSDIYIRCRKCFYLWGIVFQFITIYDKYDSCVNRVSPCRVRVPLLGNAVAKMQARTYYDNFFNQHGLVQNKILIYWNKSSHDTYYFEKLLAGGKKIGKKKNP